MVRIISQLALIILFCTVSVCSYAQPKGRAIVDQTAEWFALTTMSKVHKKVSIMLEGQFRYVEQMDPLQFQLRTGVEYGLNKHWFVTLGYVYTWNEHYGKQPAAFVNNEHRIWEQVNYKNSYKRFFMSHRFRVEQRFIQEHSKTETSNAYSNYQNRLRYRFMTNIPLNHATMDAKTVYLNLYDEVFYGFGNTDTFNEPDQNRIYLGFGYQFTKLVQAHVGPFYQMLIKSNGAKQENNVGFQLQVNYNFDFTKKEEVKK